MKIILISISILDECAVHAPFYVPTGLIKNKSVSIDPGNGLSLTREQVIAWAMVNPDMRYHMASLGPNVLEINCYLASFHN